MVSGRILVVDDEKANLAFAHRVLSRGGWRVTIARDGIEAVAVARATVPDVVLMDVAMPGQDGWAATAALRAGSDAAASVAILAFTSARVDEGMLRGGGFDGFVGKPCTPEALVAAVATWSQPAATTGYRRLEGVFRRDELATLLAHLRDELAAAIAAPTIDADVAHRIAGAAGTLGFMTASVSWQVIAAGAAADEAGARRDARLVIAAIARLLG